MDTEPYPIAAGLLVRKTGHVVVSVPLMRSGYGYGTVPDRRRTIGTEGRDVESSVPHSPIPNT